VGLGSEVGVAGVGLGSEVPQKNLFYALCKFGSDTKANIANRKYILRT